MANNGTYGQEWISAAIRKAEDFDLKVNESKDIIQI